MNSSLVSSADLSAKLALEGEGTPRGSGSLSPLSPVRLLEALNASPVIARTANLHFVWFGVFAALSALSGGLVLSYYLWAAGCRAEGLLAWGILGIAAGNWIGARSFHLIALGRKLLARPGKYLVETGFYVQGGIAGITLTALLLAAELHLSALTLLDGVALAGLAALVPGRLGCFNYGCCYGRPTTVPWGVRYHSAEAKVLRLKPHRHGRPLHPTQLYLAGANALAFAGAVAMLRAGAPQGMLAATFLVDHGALRLGMERLRDDVNFNDGRNWFTHHVAAITVCAGLAIFGADRLLPGGLFAPAVLEETLSLAGAASFFAAHPATVAGSLLAAALMFAGYGVHGPRLGVFPGARR